MMYKLVNEQLSDNFWQTTSSLSFKKCYNLSSLNNFFSFAPNVVLTTTMLMKFPSSNQNLPKVIARRDTRNGANCQTYDIRHNSKKMYINLYRQKATILCFSPGSLTLSSFKYWLAIPYSFGSIGLTFLLISSIEFLASQTPYSTWGLMIGAGYGSLFIILFTGIA